MEKNIVKEYTKENVDDEISFIEIVLFIQSSINSIFKSTVVFLASGAIFYFYTPSFYEAKVTLQMAQVAGISIETPILLLEKINFHFFLDNCGDGLLQ